MSDDPTFSAQQGYAAQSALREALGMGPASFAVKDLVRMLGDEIAAHRKAGHDWSRIAGIVSDAAGQTVTAQQIERNHGAG